MPPPEAPAQPPASNPDSTGTALASVLALTAICGAIRLIAIGSKPFWFDECFSAEIARIDWRDFARLLWWREANMSLYYLLLRVWLAIDPHAIQGAGYIRSLSAVFAAATVPAIYWLARSLYDRRVALIAATLFTFNAYSVRYSQEARSYALFVLLATIASGLFVLTVRERSARNSTRYALAGILAVYAHLYALLLFAAHWLALRLLREAPGQAASIQRSSMRRSSTSRSWKIIGIGVMPLLVFVAKTGAGPIRWIPRPSLRDLLWFGENLSGGNSWLLFALYIAGCIVAIAPFGRRMLTADSDWAVWRVQFLLIWLIFPVAATVLLSFFRPVFLGRYMIFCLPALLILVAAGVARLQKSWMLAASVAMMLLLSSQGVLFIYGHDFDQERDGSGAAVNFILNNARAGDGAVFHIAESRVPYEFFRSAKAGANTASPKFASALGPEILFPQHGAGLEYRDFTGKPGEEALRAAALSHPRLWVMLMYNERAGRADPTTEMMDRTLGGEFARVQRWHFARVELRLYSRE